MCETNLPEHQNENRFSDSFVRGSWISVISCKHVSLKIPPKLTQVRVTETHLVAIVSNKAELGFQERPVTSEPLDGGFERFAELDLFEG